MPLVELIYDCVASQCHVIPFARNPRVGNAPAAAGPTVRFACAELESVGIPAIRRLLEQYSTNDINQPSEFYGSLAKVKRDEILGRSVVVGISWKKSADSLSLSSAVRGRNVDVNLPWSASQAEVADAIQHVVKKAAVVTQAQQEDAFRIVGGVLWIAGTSVHNNVLDAVTVRDHLHNRDVIVAILDYRHSDVVRRYDKRNVIAFTVDGSSAWQVEEAASALHSATGEEVYTRIIREKSNSLQAITYDGRLLTVNVSDGSVEGAEANKRRH